MYEDVIVESWEPLLVRIYGEYHEMPGLRLTYEQARRLWGLDEVVCTQLLAYLVQTNYLYRSADGRYARPTDVAVASSRLRTAKADIGEESASRGRRRQTSAA